MDILPWNENLLTRTVNFHGEDLLSSLSKRYRDEIQHLDCNSITYRRYFERKQLLSKYSSHNDILLQFIHHMAKKIFKTTEQQINKQDRYNEVFRDIRNFLPPLEYCMNVHTKIRNDMFFRNVEKDDLLFGYIDSCPSENIYTVKILSTVATKHRCIKDCDIMAFMREEETQAEPGFREENGRWKVNTPLLTQVQMVQSVGQSTAILVGTRDSTSVINNQNMQLGKATKDCLSPSIIKMLDNKLPTYYRGLENVGAFQSSYSWKKSMDYLSKHYTLDLKVSSTLMKIDIIPRLLKPEDQYKLARRCVAEGVAHYRAGENKEALEALQAALSIDKNHVDALMARGTLWANLSKFEKAIEDFELVIHLKPDHATARRYACETLLQLADSYVDMGQLPEAEEKYQHCLEIDHKFTAAREGLQKIGRSAVPHRRNTIPLQEKAIFEPFMNPEPPSNVSPLLSSNIPPTAPRTIGSKSSMAFNEINKNFEEPPAKKQFMSPASSSYQNSQFHIPGCAPLNSLITVINDDCSGPYKATLDPNVFAKLKDLIKPNEGGDEFKISLTEENLNKGDKDAGVCRGGTKEIHGSRIVEDCNICVAYIKGNCKFGASGHNCSKTHPRYCKTYLKKGECPNGWLFCAKGPHPLVCKNSLNLGICYVKGCNYLHLNKTKKSVSTNKLGSVGFIVNSVKLKEGIELDESNMNGKIKKKKKRPLHRHYWRKLWELKMARIELRSQKNAL